MTYCTGISQVLICHVGAGRTDLPGVSKQLRRRLDDALSCCKVVLGIAVEVAAQTPDPALQVGCQAHVDTHTWK